MRCLIIIVEGKTESTFVREVLSPYMWASGIFDVRAIQVSTSRHQKGGMVNYDHFEHDTKRYLLQESDVLVTSLIDYYALPNNFPGYADAMGGFEDSLSRVESLEQSLAARINHPRFVPYIQLHEFEALLFADERGFAGLIGGEGSRDKLLREICTQFPNPEDINDHPSTAPSKRLAAIIPGYDKVIDGNFIALENGIDAILDRCPRFRKWVETLIARMQAPA